MSSPVSVLYLVPHSHTDLGYTHDPVIATELHDHFLDRAVTLCEQTAQAPEHARFAWTIEVFFSLEHWWARRGTRDRERLLALMREGRIDLGLRYTNGTMLHAPVNIEWEVERAVSFCREHGLRGTSFFQNDVNGVSIGYARELVKRGATGLVMGLNTTMGVSPRPRPGAFRWNVGVGQLLVWHGWIYNRIGRYVHLNELEDKLEGAWPELIARLPEGYPFPFTLMSATIGDNVGPFAALPRQVAAFNAKQTGLEVRLATISGFLARLDQEKNLPELAGDWNDAWIFGHGSMPHEAAMVRRAQRRLEVLRGLCEFTPAPDPAVASLIDQAQAQVSLACEHTYESHTSADDHTLGDDGKRQWVECQVSFAAAESYAMLALRKAWMHLAERHRASEPSLLLVNPFDHPLPMRVLLNRKLATNIATSEALEHLTQVDREPTIEGLTRMTDCGVPEVLLPPHTCRLVPLKALAELRTNDVTDVGPAAEMATGELSLRLDEDGSLANLRRAGSNRNWIDPSAGWRFGLPVLERPDPATPLQYKSEAEKRDPSDAEWNPNLKLHRQHAGHCVRLTRSAHPYFQRLSVDLAGSPVRRIAYQLDALTPGLLELEVEVRLDDASAMRALYLPFTFDLPGSSDVLFRYDSCGVWVDAPAGQLPGAGTSVYESYRGVTIEREGRCIYLIAPDAPLWQFGGFTFGHPHAKIDRRRAFVSSWLYNNYWYTNFPSVAPGWFRIKYLIALTEQPFDAAYADDLYHRFSVPYLFHPVWPVDPTRSITRP
jgi:hypothetical protein